MQLHGMMLLAVLAPTTGAAQYQSGRAAAHAERPVERTRTPRADFATTPPEAGQAQDPADSVYRRAREALNRSDYWRAAELFQQIRERHPRSGYVADAYYWEAYARYRRGGTEGFRLAADLLDTQAERFPNAATRNDARSLATRIRGELARRGDADAARAVVEAAAAAAPPEPPEAPEAPRAPRQSRRSTCAEDDVQAAALNAVMQMRREQALPIVRRVLARRDAGSECLRRKAVFIASQVGGDEAGEILLTTARTDPDAEVQSQAVFWLSQVSGPRAVSALDSILASARSPQVQDKAIFALSQHDSREARQALRRYAERGDIPADLREKAVFWIGQSNDPENTTFLIGLFGRVRERSIKDKILFSVSQTRDPAAARFLGEVARNTGEPIEVRKKALFWFGQRDGVSGADIAGLYDSFTDREIKEQLVFVLSQKQDRAAVDKLLDIARREQDRELRKKAIFWLSQSNDPRVADFLAELLEKP